MGIHTHMASRPCWRWVGEEPRIETVLNNSYEISIVIPAYNESARLGRSLDRVLDFVRQQGWDAEVIVVDDGSRDATADLVREYARTNPIVRLVQNPGNRGKGYSVRSGMLSARGSIVLFTDADLSSPIEEAPKLLEALKAGADVAIGSRWLRSELQTQRQSMARQVLGRIFNVLLRICLDLNSKTRSAVSRRSGGAQPKCSFPLAKIEGWGFDPEILFLARQDGLRSSRGSGGRGPTTKAPESIQSLTARRWCWKCCEFGGTR